MSGSRRTFPVRTWLAVALAAVFVVPAFVIVAFYFHVAGVEPPRYAAAAAVVQSGVGQWRDPAWQTAASEELAALGIAFVLLDGGEEIYDSRSQSTATNGPPWNDEAASAPGQSITVVDDTGALTIDLYQRTQPWATFRLIPLVALSALLLTIAVTAWFLGRTVSRSLAAMGQAARQIAAGDLEISLPPTRIREVAEVSEAFEAMSVELGASLRHQAALEQERRLFIGAVVHDLRTPLFSLRGYLEGLEQGLAETPAKRARYIAGAKEKAAALDRLVADLFNYTRLEYLDQAPNQEPLELAPLLHRLVDGLQPQAAAKQVSLTLANSADTCPVAGDSHLLTRAVENLLDNAVRYTPAGGDVRVECHAEPGRIVFSVADAGPGIPPADLPHLFSPLFRGETSRNRRTGGAGLGLTVARRILRAHGGELTVENQTPHGAVFTGVLPLPATAGGAIPPAA